MSTGLSHLLTIGLQIQGLSGASVAKPSSPEPVAGTSQAAASPKADAAGGRSPAKAGSAPEAPRHMQPANALPGPSTTKTRQLYQDNTYLFEHVATLLDVWEEGDKVCIELDQTIFHPQGGGQPSDVGSVTAEGLPPLEVVFVQMDKAKAGVIRHECKGDLAAWRAAASLKKPVMCTVDGDKRREFARIHSAGHLLDVAMHDLGFLWRPGKGYHFPDGPYVEYAIVEEGRQLDNKDGKAKQTLIDELSARMKELISKAGGCRVEFIDGVRTVTFEDVSCGCGGTHVTHAGEIGEVVIKKLQAKSGNMRVSYAVI